MAYLAGLIYVSRDLWSQKSADVHISLKITQKVDICNNFIYEWPNNLMKLANKILHTTTKYCSSRKQHMAPFNQHGCTKITKNNLKSSEKSW